jgi:hypothetical protein
MSRESDLAKLVEDARHAVQREQDVFVVKLKTSVWSQPGHGEIDAWSESLQAVERLGWTLTHWSTSADSGGNVSAYPVFRRRRQTWEPPSPPP